MLADLRCMLRELRNWRDLRRWRRLILTLGRGEYSDLQHHTRLEELPPLGLGLRFFCLSACWG
jgi:hypothetical protein